MISIIKIYFFDHQMQIETCKIILYHKNSIKQIEYKNKVWFFLHFFAFASIINYVLYVIKKFMKKVFIQIRQWILRHRKKLIYWALALFIGQICFFGLDWLWIGSEVYAVDSPTQNDLFQKKVTEWYEEISFFNKVVYVLIYPLLLLAWKLVDNSLVYWEIFWFDAVLWQLWNILKNLANYTLWFIFVYKIFDFLIIKKESWKVKKLLISALIAWVWIQASRFFMASLIDISTILAYSVWWLPISILKQTGNGIDNKSVEHNPYVLKNIVDVNVKDTNTTYMYLTNTQTWDKKSGAYYISECETFSYKNGWRSEELILAPKIIYYNETGGAYKQTDKLRCHFFGQVYYFTSLYGEIPNNFVSCSNDEQCKSAQIEYQNVLGTAKQKIIASQPTEVRWLIESVQVLQIWDAHVTWWVIWTFNPPIMYTQDRQWLDLHNKWTGSWTTSRLQDILDGHSYVGVFTALYSSLLNSWRWVIPPDAWTFSALLSAVLSFWHVLAIGIPLIAVALVFIMRIWILWVAVVLSPFIVLFSAFDELWEKVFKWSKFLEYFSLKNLIPIILSPAIVCFAISISTVLVTIISGLNFNSIAIAKKEILGWLVELDIWGLSIWFWKFIISVLWIAVTWFLVWAAVESSKLWKSGIVQGVKNFATSALWSMPIIPVIWKDENWKLKTDFVWTRAAFGSDWIISGISNDIKNKFSEKDNRVVQDIINPEWVKKRRAEAYKTAITSFSPVATKAWTTEEITLKSEDGSGYKCKFVDLLDSEKEWIIAAINGLDATKTAAFWNSEPSITFNNWKGMVTYEFKNGKYEKKWN